MEKSSFEILFEPIGRKAYREKMVDGTNGCMEENMMMHREKWKEEDVEEGRGRGRGEEYEEEQFYFFV